MTTFEQAQNSSSTAHNAAELDDALIQRCLMGEETAFSALYARFAPAIFRLAYGLLQHKEDAEEVLQDTFEYAFRRIDAYDVHKAGFKTWLYQICVSRSRNKRRRKWLPTFPFGQLGEEAARDRRQSPPDEQLMLDARQKAIWNALNTLSPKLRETAILRYYEELTYPEIGRILDIPSKTAESRMRLAHAALKRALAGTDWE